MSEVPPRRSLLEVITQPGPQTTVTLVGELDPATAPDLQAELSGLAGDATVTAVTLDLGRITFLDSSGVRALLAGSEGLRARGAALVLRDPNPNVRRVLEVTGLAELISVE